MTKRPARPPRATRALGSTTFTYRLRLLGGFELTRGDRPLRIAASSQRLLAFLAVQTQSRDRGWVAAQLWTDSPEDRAQANMRSALWRLRRLGGELVRSVGPQVKLSSAVELDLREFEAGVRRAAGRAAPDDARAAVELLSHELLPEWTDDWVLDERERLRQAGLHALEASAYALLDESRASEAVEVALAAVQAEPSRETAQRALISAHIAEGNYSEALGRYEQYCRLLRDELGLAPSPLLRQLMRELIEPRRKAS